jgi:hypothetical protein
MTAKLMHSGPLVFLRVYMFYAKPWQQLLICAIFVLAGAALLVLLGQLAGVIPVVFGIGVGIPLVSLRVRGSRHR